MPDEIIRKRRAKEKLALCGIFILGAVCFFAYLMREQRTEQERVAGARELEAQLELCAAKTEKSTKKDPEYLLCVKREISHALEVANVSVRSVLDIVDKGFENNGETARVYCHDVTHHVGRELARLKHDTIRGALGECTNACNNGCDHGLLEYYIGSLSEKASMYSISRLCQPLFFHSPAFETQCFHGLGHGLTSFTKDIKKSLALCSRFFWSNQRENCEYGAMMEHLVKNVHSEESRSADSENTLSLCKNFDDAYRDICYMVLGAEGVERDGSNFDWLFSRCEREAPEEHKDACFAAIGFQIARTRNWDVRSSLMVCERAGDRQKKGCYSGLLADAGSNRDFSVSFPKLCRTIESAYRKNCWWAFANSLLARLPLYTL